MGVKILFGSSSASKDKCFLLLLFLLLKARLWALHSGWESAEPISAWLAGVMPPEGGGQSHGLGAEGRGAAGWPHTPHIVLRGWKWALLMLDHAVNQPDAPDRQRSPSIVGIYSYRQIFFSVCFYHLNSNCDNKNGSLETCGILINSFSKSIGKRDIIVGALPLTEI